MRRLSTWEVLREVDFLMKNSPGWIPMSIDEPRRCDFVSESAFRDKRRRQRDREARRRHGKHE